MGLDLLSTFILTRYIFVVFSPEEDPDFVVEDVEQRLRPDPNLACSVDPPQDDSASASL